MMDNNSHYNTGDYNTGNRNTGNRNTGNRNTGNWNTGHYNTGNYNTGDRNTGNWNTGNYNTGNYNTGNRNTGYCNTGYCNIGNWNGGNCNTGNWNTADWHVGCFNTIDAEKAYYFNKLIDKELWDLAYKPDWLYLPSQTSWVLEHAMTDQEKADNPTHKTTGGYLRTNDMKEQWRKAYEGASEEDIQAVRDLPGFDYDVFEEITGLDLHIVETTPSCEGKEVEIDGVVYVLVKKGNE